MDESDDQVHRGKPAEKAPRRYETAGCYLGVVFLATAVSLHAISASAAANWNDQSDSQLLPLTTVTSTAYRVQEPSRVAMSARL